MSEPVIFDPALAAIRRMEEACYGAPIDWDAPILPSEWPGGYMHDIPLTSSEDRRHILDTTCWCGPTVEGGKVTHHEATS